MNAMELALRVWREEKGRYQKLVKCVIAELSKPLQFILSPSYEAKEEELREYLKYSYIHEEDEPFFEVYIHHIAGRLNTSLMQLSNYMVNDLGGSVNFWQNKILDMAFNTSYHPDLSIWEINRAFETYLGLSPEFLYNLKKKRTLAKFYLSCLAVVCKLIDKSKATQEDMAKIDESFKKLKKGEEKYYAFMEEVEGLVVSKQVENISQTGKNKAKNNLFNFFRRKEEKINTLANYNFRVEREETQRETKLLKGKQYDQLDNLFSDLMAATKSQRQSIYSQVSNSRSKFRELSNNQPNQAISLGQLRSQYLAFMKHEKLQIQTNKQRQYQNTFIWSKQYFFSYWGYPVKPEQKISFTEPFEIHDHINYDIDSADEYDQLNAEDVEGDDELSSESSLSNNNSFVVDDDYESDEERGREKDNIFSFKNNVVELVRWSKNGEELKDYETICCCPFETLPLPLDDTIDNFDDKFIEKLEGKGKSQILSIFMSEQRNVSKGRIQSLLKNDFKKVRNKNRQLIYVRANKTQVPDRQSQQVEGFSDQDTTSQIYQISITCLTRPVSALAATQEETLESIQGTTESKPKKELNDTIIEEQLPISEKEEALVSGKKEKQV